MVAVRLVFVVTVVVAVVVLVVYIYRSLVFAVCKLMLICCCVPRAAGCLFEGG